MFEDSDKTYKEFFSMPIIDSLPYYIHRKNYAKQILLQASGRDQEANDILEDVIREMPEIMDIDAYCVYAFAQHRIGNDTVAYDIMHQLEDISPNTDDIKYWRYILYSETGKYKQALKDLEHSVIHQNSVILAQLRQALLKEQYDFVKAESDSLKKQNKLQEREIVSISISGLLLVLLLILLIKKKKAEADARIDELSALHQEAQRMLEKTNKNTNNKETDKEALQAQFATIFNDHYTKLHELCAAYLSPSKNGNHAKVYEEVKRQIEDIKHNDAAQAEFMNTVNESLDNIIDKLRADLPDHKEHDFLFLAYVIAGFEAKTIAGLMGITTNSVYTKKNRLKNELINTKSPNLDLYMSHWGGREAN